MKSWISHNQGVCAGVVLSVILLVWTFGCQSTVRSPISDKMVTRQQLTVEVGIKARQLESELDALTQRAEVSYQELDRQDEIKRKLFQFASLTAQTNTVNPMGVITLVGTLLGGGLLVDNRIKDKVIKNRPINGNGTTEA